MKNILGLDLGTNSIGWAVVNGSINDNGSEQLVKIQASGSRIIPMDAAMIGDFNKGNSISQTAERTRLRGIRRLSERYLLRRERLHRILDILGFLPSHFAQDLDRHGKIVKGKEPKLAWRKNEAGQFEFIFQDSFKEMLEDFKLNHPNLITDDKKVPYDWTIYYLRKKGLTSKISKEELAWILLNFNQKRGYYQLRGEEEKKNDNVMIINSKVIDVVKAEKDKKYEKYWYNVLLENGLLYRAAFYNDISFWKGHTKEFVLKTIKLKSGGTKQELSFLPSFDEIEKMEKKQKDKMYFKIKLKTGADIDQTHKTVGTYIYDTLLGNPSQKIRGRLVRTIERKYYKEELKQILDKQKEFHPELQDRALYAACVEELYTINEAHRNNIGNRDFTYLFLEGKEPKLAWRKNEAGQFEFIFQDSFKEMLEDFKLNHPNLITDDKKVPYDWTIYYLRKKGLTSKISKEELAWILLNFNQKRGYYQLRGEEEKKNDNVMIINSKVIDVVKAEKDKKYEKYWYNVLLENGLLYRAAFYNDISFWKGHTKEFVLKTIKLKSGGTKQELSFLPSFDEIEKMEKKQKDKMYFKIKLKTGADIDQTHKTVGTYIYDTLLGNPSQKIRGRLVRTIERKYYKEELKQILDKQKEFHPELQDRALYAACVEELYTINEAHRNNIGNRDFTYLFLEDILFYQRPLKSKKSLIDNCPYEENHCLDKETGEIKSFPVKCIAKSHPLFQEFRLWQFIVNLRIYRKGLAQDVDVTNELLKTEEDYVALFDWLNGKKEIDQKAFLKYPLFGLKKEVENYRWNYVQDKPYPCNETRSSMLARLEKCDISIEFLTKENEEALWHILYSVEDKNEIVKALQKFADKHDLNASFVDVFRKFPPFKKEYGSYSAKAIKKLLPLMRMGKYWSENSIDKGTRERIDKIITGEYDEKIENRVREKAIHLADVSDFRGLPLWLVCYIVYGRHSEAKEITQWKSPADIDSYLKSFKQHSLRNPIVEQIIIETLRVVRDIWKQVGNIDEIHVELGREMKNPADKRKKMTQQMSENENTNLRIKYLLTEFLNPEYEVENVRPYSPSQQDILRIYEEGVLNSVSDLPEEISDILKKFTETDLKKRPSRSEVLRYKLWLEQKYRSPYTGEVIPLGKLFTPAYEIEHVIPQSCYFDDSFSNKVICEAEVNKLKSNLLGHEFIVKHHGEIVELPFGKKVRIFTVDEYEQFVKDNYSRTRGKMKKLLMDDIPEEFVTRQLNDSRYISKVVKSLLSNIVREKGEEEAISKNVIPCTGGVTDRLKKDWGINEVWNKIILPRFQRLNELTGTNKFTTKNVGIQEIPTMPLELQKGFNKKRIDHRHHAMDAIIIACANRNIINYLNNESATAKAELSRYDLQKLLCDKAKTDNNGNYKWVIRKPWASFTQDTYLALENIIVSFKQNLRVINKATNHFLHYNEEGKKIFVKQGKGDNWAIRKSMHKDTVFGEVNLRRIKTVALNEAMKNPQSIVVKDFKRKLLELWNLGFDAKRIKKYFEDNRETWSDINLSKIEVYYFSKDTKDRFFATRKPLDTSFDRKKIENNITDTGIQKILLRHLELKDNNPDIAFSPDGIDEMNRNIIQLNNGKYHQPIIKVRWYEQADKFAVGQTGNKSSKFVEAAKGTNLFFAVYESNILDKKTNTIIKKRNYATIPLNVAIERQKQGLPVAPEDENGNDPIFVLSPNDLVYLPTAADLANGIIAQPLDRGRIYKMVSCTGNEGHFIPARIANPILQTIELGSNNKAQKAWTDEMIKEICMPIKVDRLGNVLESSSSYKK